MVWNERNNVYHGSIARHLPELCTAPAAFELAGTEGKDSIHMSLPAADQTGGQHSSVVWCCPSYNVLKINVDAAIFKEVGIGMGIVIRDHGGHIFHMACQKVKHLWETNVTEGKAIVLGMKMATQCYAWDIIIESNCLQVVKMINENKCDESYADMVVKDT